jgi:hypothetical protein
MNIQDEIARVTRYGQQLEVLLDGKVLKLSGDRDALIIAYRSLLLDYHTAIVTLLPKELYGAVFALLRPIVEAWVRIHVAKMGSDETVLQLKNDTYRVDFSKIGVEIDKAFDLDFFAKSLDKAIRDALHSYTHSGSFQTARRFDESATKSRYSDGAILNVIEGSMTALFMATILVTKHFGFEDEWRKATVLFTEYNKRPFDVPE